MNLRTNLPLRSTAALLARLANDTTLDGFDRVEAAGALARVDQKAGVALLTSLANDTTFRWSRNAAGALARYTHPDSPHSRWGLPPSEWATAYART